MGSCKYRGNENDLSLPIVDKRAELAFVIGVKGLLAKSTPTMVIFSCIRKSIDSCRRTVNLKGYMKFFSADLNTALPPCGAAFPAARVEALGFIGGAGGGGG